MSRNSHKSKRHGKGTRKGGRQKTKGRAKDKTPEKVEAQDRAASLSSAPQPTDGANEVADKSATVFSESTSRFPDSPGWKTVVKLGLLVSIVSGLLSADERVRAFIAGDVAQYETENQSLHTKNDSLIRANENYAVENQKLHIEVDSLRKATESNDWKIKTLEALHAKFAGSFAALRKHNFELSHVVDDQASQIFQLSRINAWQAATIDTLLGKNVNLKNIDIGRQEEIKNLRRDFEIIKNRAKRLYEDREVWTDRNDLEAVKESINIHFSRINSLARNAQAKTPGLSGRLDIQFSVDVYGAVLPQSPKVLNSKLENAHGFTAEILAEIGTWDNFGCAKQEQGDYSYVIQFILYRKSVSPYVNFDVERPPKE